MILIGVGWAEFEEFEELLGGGVFDQVIRHGIGEEAGAAGVDLFLQLANGGGIVDLGEALPGELGLGLDMAEDLFPLDFRLVRGNLGGGGDLLKRAVN